MLTIPHLNITLFLGAVLNIYGANGCGKTTLLNNIAGLSDDSDCLIKNKSITQHNIYDYFLYIDYIEHDISLDVNFTVIDHLLLWANLNASHLAIPAAIHLLGLESVINSKIMHLSKGFKKRVDLARLLLLQKMIWIIDEPFANLDIDYRDIIMQMMITKANNGGIVVFTNHQKVDNILNIKLDIQRDIC